MKDRSLLLIDTASLYFRAFYALPDSFRGQHGQPTNAIRGLADFVAHAVAQGYSHAACCWDVDWRPGWRVAAVPTYKTHRLSDSAAAQLAPVVVERSSVTLRDVSSVELSSEETPDELEAQLAGMLDVLHAAGVPVIGADAHEADDVIGTLAEHAGMPVDVLTGDRDLFQLIDDERQIRVLYTTKGVATHAVMDAAAVREKYGVEPQQYADFALLRGDASDGLPGVAGIGEKTAAKLLGEYGTVEATLSAALDPSSALAKGVRAKLLAGQDYLGAARDVVAVARDIPYPPGLLDALELRGIADTGALARLRDELNLGGAGERLASALAATA